MRVNDKALEIIKAFEGFSSVPYLDPIGIATIGFGSIWDINGDRITMRHVPINNDEATELLRKEVHHVEAAIKKLISAELTENMFSAIGSLTYNIGTGNLQRSTLRIKINRGKYLDAADEFPKWRRAGGKILKGLVRRRAVERTLFLMGYEG
jgi:lysozyme